jgi:stress response protein YsnF
LEPICSLAPNGASRWARASARLLADVTLERRPVDRDLAPSEAAFRERTIEAVERGEEVVVSKTARVTEEIGLRKDLTTDAKLSNPVTTTIRMDSLC